MDIQKLKETTYDKLKQEYTEFYERLLICTPNTIIRKAQEISGKQRILNLFHPAMNNFSQEQLHSALYRNYVLDSLYWNTETDINYAQLLYNVKEQLQNDYNSSNIQEPVRVFFDIDGCTAEFKPTTKFEDLFEKGYFRNLKPLDNVVETVKLLNQSQDFEVYILSSTLEESRFAKQEKKEWIKEHLPELTDEQVILSECGKSKVDFVPGGIRNTDILLDDYNINLREWSQAGAKAVKVVNGINDRTHSWTGERIYHSNNPSEAIDTIRKVANLDDSNSLQYKPILPNEVSTENSLPTLDFLF